MDTAVYSMLIIHIFMKILGCYYDTSVNTRYIIFMRTYLAPFKDTACRYLGTNGKPGNRTIRKPKSMNKRKGNRS